VAYTLHYLTQEILWSLAFRKFKQWPHSPPLPPLPPLPLR